MSMTTVSSLSGEGGRTFAISVTGSPDQARLRTSAYTVKVPYSSLAKTIHSIGQRGGKVVDVKLLTTQLTDLAGTPASDSSKEQVAPTSPAKATSNPAPDSSRSSAKSKKR